MCCAGPWPSNETFLFLYFIYVQSSFIPLTMCTTVSSAGLTQAMFRLSTQWKSKHGNGRKRKDGKKKVSVWFSCPGCGIFTGCPRALQRWGLHQNKCCFLVGHGHFAVFLWSQLFSHEASRLLCANQVSRGSISPLPPSWIGGPEPPIHLASAFIA